MRQRYIKPLRKQEQLDLRMMYRFGQGREGRRAQAILLSSQGYSTSQISEITGVWAKTVRAWLDRFETEGVVGLKDQVHPGRPRKLTDEVKQVLEESAHQEPASFGYSYNNWTLEHLRRHLRLSLGVRLSLSSVHNGLEQQGIHWGTAKAKVTSPDPAYRPKAKAIQAAKRNDEPDTAVIFEDETDIHLNPDIGRSWMLAGHQLEVDTPRQNEKLYLFGAVNWKTGQLWHLFREHKTEWDYLEFLFQMEWHVKAGKILWISDNYSIHHTPLIQEFFLWHPRFEVRPLPTYSPWLNCIERFWKHLRSQVTVNRFYHSMKKLRQRIHRFFAYYRRRPDLVLSVIGAVPP